MPTPDLEREYTLAEVANALRMSPRWVRDRIRLDGIAYQRYGKQIRFTAEQLRVLREAHTHVRVVEAVTTGPSKLDRLPDA